jgi:hypothetical protein
MPNIDRPSIVLDSNATLSRRGLFRQAGAMIGGVAAVLATGSQAIAKMVQKAAGYQATPKGDQSCATCALFKVPAPWSMATSLRPGGAASSPRKRVKREAKVILTN